MANIGDFNKNMTSIASSIRAKAGIIQTSKLSVTSMISTLLNLTAMNDTSGVYSYMEGLGNSMIIPTYAESIGAYAFAGMRNYTSMLKAKGLRYDSHAFDDCVDSVLPTNYNSDGGGTYNKGTNAPARETNGNGQGVTVDPTIRTTLLENTYTTFNDNFYGLASTIRAIANLETPLTIPDMKTAIAALEIGQTQHILARIIDRTITDLTLDETMFDFAISRNRLRNCANLSRLVLSKPAYINGQSLTGCQPILQISCTDSTTFDANAFYDDDETVTARADCTYMGSATRESCIFSYTVTTGYISNNEPKTSTIAFKYSSGSVIVRYGCNQNGYGADSFGGTNGTAGAPIASVHFLNAPFVGQGAFRGYQNQGRWDCDISYVDLTGVERVGANAFGLNNHISVIVWPTNIIQLNSAVFDYVSGIVNLSIPSNVELLGAAVFHAGFYRTINWVCNISSCAASTFTDCVNLSSVSIGGTPTILGQDIFRGCSSMVNITLPNTISRFESGCFYGCSKLANINMPTALEIIGANVFEDCTSWRKNGTINLLDIPVTSILSRAFAYTSMSQIILPSTLRFLGSDVFRSCTRLMRSNNKGPIQTISVYCPSSYIWKNNSWVNGHPGVDIDHFAFISNAT